MPQLPLIAADEGAPNVGLVLGSPTEEVSDEVLLHEVDEKHEAEDKDGEGDKSRCCTDRPDGASAPGGEVGDSAVALNRFKAGSGLGERRICNRSKL